jgi:hypothetical protein
VLEKTLSKNGTPIRLTDERWAHITEEHCELAGLRLEVMETVANPARIVAGKGGELLAVREIDPGQGSCLLWFTEKMMVMVLSSLPSSRAG